MLFPCTLIFLQNVHLHMELTLTEDCWITFCMFLITVMFLNNYYSPYLLQLELICLWICIVVNDEYIIIENLFFQSICKVAPFSDDPDANLERERCDYTNCITYKVAKSGRGTVYYQSFSY